MVLHFGNVKVAQGLLRRVGVCSGQGLWSRRLVVDMMTRNDRFFHEVFLVNLIIKSSSVVGTPGALDVEGHARFLFNAS